MAYSLSEVPNRSVVSKSLPFIQPAAPYLVYKKPLMDSNFSHMNSVSVLKLHSLGLIFILP